MKRKEHTDCPGKARGFPIKAFGSILDEPFTGVIYLKQESGITSDFASLKGKRIGYVGEFGKIQIDELTKYYNMSPSDYTTVRCGMNISKALIDGTIDAGIGLENVQQVELEEWLKGQGRPTTDVAMLRIDELAELGCCCFCSILLIGNEAFIESHPEEVRKFMRAIKSATDYVLREPVAAYDLFCQVRPEMASPLNRAIYERSLNYLSRDLACVPRDWQKVTAYAARLGVVDDAFVANYTNEYLSWPRQADDDAPLETQVKIGEAQASVREHGGVFSGHTLFTRI